MRSETVLLPFRAECPACETDSGMIVATDVGRAGEQLEEMGWGQAEMAGGRLWWYCPGCWPVVSGADYPTREER